MSEQPSTPGNGTAAASSPPHYGPQPPSYGQPPPAAPYQQSHQQAPPAFADYGQKLPSSPSGMPYASPTPYGTATPYGSAMPYNTAAQHGSPITTPNYAPWARRALAFLIDRLPALAGSAVLSVVYALAFLEVLRNGTNGSRGPDFDALLWPAIIGGVLSLLGLAWDIYNRWIVAGRTGRSLGKRAMHILLVSEQTRQPIGPLNAFCRDLIHLLDGAAYVGFLWPLWDDKRQTFADMLMKTIVVMDPPSAEPPR